MRSEVIPKHIRLDTTTLVFKCVKCIPISLTCWVEKYENIFKCTYNRNAVYVK